MTEPARHASLDDLLAHRRWVRAVALRLATNAADADDLEQDAWLAAIRNPPLDVAPKAWLGTVLRNLVRTRFRRTERRERHELAAGSAATGRRGTGGGAEDVAAAAELQTRLARAVLDLDEPVRTTMLLRFFEGLDPPEIARRSGVPLETVRTRLKRGVATLRGRLGPELGPSDRAWCMLVLGSPVWSPIPSPGADGGAATRPGAPPGRVTASSTGAAAAAGGLAMGLAKKAVVAGCVLLLALATWQVTDVVRDPEPPIATHVEGDAADRGAPPAPRTGRAHTESGAATSGAASEAARREIVVEVVLPDGRPASGATVELLREDAVPVSEFVVQEILQTTPPRVERSVLADDAGVARVPVPADVSRAVLVARRSGCAATAARAPSAETTSLRLRLGEAFALRGRVIDGTGAPVPGATVVAERGSWSRIGAVAARALAARATCDESGAFAFDALGAGVVPLRAARPGGAFVRAAKVRVPDVGTIDIVLAHDLTLAGRVTDADTGRPVADAKVRASLWFESVSFAAEATTGADGEWRLEHIPVSFVHVTASCAGYVDPAAGGPAAAIDLASSAAPRCDLALRRGAVLSGRVTSPDGPVAGATVTAAHTSGLNVLRATTTTAADGRYELASVAPGENVVVVSAKGWLQEGFPSMWSDVVRRGTAPPAAVADVPAGGRATLDVALARGVAVAGRVVGPGDDPVAGASVLLAYADPCESNGPWCFLDAKTDAEGRFRLTGVAPSSRPVSVRASGVQRRMGETQVALDPVEGAQDVVVRMTDMRRVVGTVTAPTGLDAGAASVEVIDWSGRAEDARSDPWENASSCDVAADGTFEMAVPTFARPWVRAVVPGRAWSAPAEIRFADGDSTARAELALSADAGVEGSVVLGDGRGVPAARVTVRAVGGPLATGSSPAAEMRDVHVLTDAAGRFRLRDLLPGPTWSLSVAADGVAPATVTFTLPVAEPVVVRTTRAARIHGSVRLADGSGVAGVRMQLIGREGAVPDVVSGPGGAFAFEGVLDSAYQIVVMSGGPANVIPRVVPGAVRPGAPVEVVVEMALAVAGRVTVAAGEAPASCYVQAFRSGEGPLASRYAGGTIVGADGSFSFAGLAAGTYSVLATPLRDSKSRSLAPAFVEGVAAGTTGLDIRLATGLMIEGRVVDATGAPVTGVSISMETPRAESAQGPVWSGVFRAAVSGDGTFRIDGLPAEEFRPVLCEAGSSRRAALQVVSPATVRAGSSGVRLVTSAAGTIRGTVVGEDGARWYVDVLASPEGDPSIVRRTRTTEQGAFQFDDLDPSRRWCISVHAAGHPVARVNDVAPGTLDVRVVIRLGLRARGRLLGADGSPAARVLLRFRRDGAEHVPLTQTLDDGTFEVIGLDGTGPWTAEASPAGDVGDGAPREWHPCGNVVGGETGVELRLPR